MNPQVKLQLDEPIAPIRRLTIKDFDYEEQIYPPEYYEDDECFRQKMAAFPIGCIAYVDRATDMMLGYSFGHPWRLDAGPVPLDWTAFKLPENPDCYYIHDIAVFPEHRGKGIGKMLMEYQLDIARIHMYKKVKLISILGSHSLWSKFGFQIVSEIEYGGKPAFVMIRELE